MDSDCLIKLTKAGLKESVCNAWHITIPRCVRTETVTMAPTLPDAVRIRENIAAGRLFVAKESADRGKGEEAVLKLHAAGGFDAVATDDTRFIRRLRVLNVPYIVPSIIVVCLKKAGFLSSDAAREAIESLRPHVSPEEYAAAVLMATEGAAR